MSNQQDTQNTDHRVAAVLVLIVFFVAFLFALAVFGLVGGAEAASLERPREPYPRTEQVSNRVSGRCSNYEPQGGGGDALVCNVTTATGRAMSSKAIEKSLFTEINIWGFQWDKIIRSSAYKTATGKWVRWFYVILVRSAAVRGPR